MKLFLLLLVGRTVTAAIGAFGLCMLFGVTDLVTIRLAVGAGTLFAFAVAVRLGLSERS